MFSNEEKRKALERELTWRQLVYSKKVAEGKMTLAEARYQINIFEEMTRDYLKLEQQERLPFGDSPPPRPEPSRPFRKA